MVCQISTSVDHLFINIRFTARSTGLGTAKAIESMPSDTWRAHSSRRLRRSYRIREQIFGCLVRTFRATPLHFGNEPRTPDALFDFPLYYALTDTFVTKHLQCDWGASCGWTATIQPIFNWSASSTITIFQESSRAAGALKSEQHRRCSSC